MTHRRQRSDASSAVRAAFDVLVFAPLGFGALLIEDSSAAVDRARQELSNARFIGRFAVDQGVAQMRSRLGSPATDDPPRSMTAATSDAPQGVPQVAPQGTPQRAPQRDVAVTIPVVPPAGGGVDAAEADDPDQPDELVRSDELALPDYDTLPAIDIVAKLATLGVEDRTAIERYESAHRRRRTVLGKLAQLAEQ
ncbi:hypothetical protein [Ilumatobacter sp.]|uniref:hypothetical protein n=1 Tax=Ilumatobacter sp. TaxID=1967498 RepID=UPI003C69CA70